MTTDISFDKVTNATAIGNGDGYFDKLMRTFNLHIDKQFQTGRLKGPEYATVYLGGMQSAMQLAQQFVLSEQLQEVQIDNALKDGILKDDELDINELKKDQIAEQTNEIADGTVRANTQLDDALVTSSKQRDAIDVDILLKGSQNAEVLADTVRKDDITIEQLAKIEAETKAINTDENVKAEQWDVQSKILDEQLGMVEVDNAYKTQNVVADINIKIAQASQIAADTSFTISKEQVMEDTREDNVRMQSAREYGEYLKYISAAGVVPSSLHFDNLVGLISGMSDKTNAEILTKQGILDTSGATTSVDSKGPYVSTAPTTNLEYFYTSTNDDGDPVWRVGNVVSSDTEAGIY